MTSGEITTVQNGTIGDIRLPVWYWTDAEISGGNSGGLVIDENGVLIGLPTWVVSEEETAGRLGGILPLVAIQKSMTVTPSLATGEGESGSRLLTIHNESDTTICFVYISPAYASDWGEDRLDSDEVIHAGRSRSWTFEAGSYDILLQDCSGDTLQDYRDVHLEAMVSFTYDGNANTVIEGADAGTLTIRNYSRKTICFVYISLNTASDWGDDQLEANEVIPMNEERRWELPSGVYDLLLQDCNGETLDDIREIDVSEGQIIEFEG